MRLPRGDQRVHMTNIQFFSMFRVKPSSAGYMVPGDMSILDSTTRQLSEYEQMCLAKWQTSRKMGSGGKLIARNMIRFMQSWDKERIHGEFWICTIVKSGTLVVQRNTESYPDGSSELGRVYLVKGINSQVGSQVPRSKFSLLVRTTSSPSTIC
mmetsp:Transcript_7646/g.16567  ORF Transcript_7646/g.16567 Transcript_7646/m.16567 type:complete len:154 (-) Transcript_7646:114-575(-)